MTLSGTLREHHDRAQEVDWKLKDALPRSMAFNTPGLADHSPIVQAIVEHPGVSADFAELWYAATGWWVCQFAETEMVALSLATSLLAKSEICPELKHNLADQVGDEARHYEIFLELSSELPTQTSAAWLREFQKVVAESPDWRLRHLALSLILESQALGNLRKLRMDTSFPRAAWAARLILADEARHVNIGRIVATSWVEEASPAEIRVAQEWIMSVLQICRDRYSEGPILPSGERLDLSETLFARSIERSGNARVLNGLRTTGLIDDTVSRNWERQLEIGGLA